jgi:uncharacterized FlgJ-related protein
VKEGFIDRVKNGIFQINVLVGQKKGLLVVKYSSNVDQFWDTVERMRLKEERNTVYERESHHNKTEIIV